MKDRRIVVNPFRMISPKLDTEARKLENLYEVPVSDSHTPEEALLVMMSKLIEMSKILSRSFVTVDAGRMDACKKLAEEVHQQESMVTSDLVKSSSTIGHNVFQIVVRFPGRLERIGDMFENILTCLKIKSSKGIPFSDKALAELTAIFALIIEMLVNMRDSLMINNRILLQHIVSQRTTLNKLLHEARFAHWDRLEAGFCAPQASSLFLDILDSCMAIGEYVGKMCDSLTALEESAASAE